MATLEVGVGQTYTTIQSAMNASAAGDVLNVHVGTYVENLSLPKSGTLANRITVQNNPGDIVLVSTTTTPVLDINSKSYWTFSGIDMKYHGTQADPIVVSQPYAGRVNYTNKYITLNDCELTLTSGSGDGFVVYIANSQNLTITNCILAVLSPNGTHDGADILYCDQLEFSGNEVYGVASTLGNLEDGIVAQGTNINIENNNFHDGWSFDNHPDAIVIQGGGNGTSGVDTDTTNVKVWRNTVKNFTQGVYFDCIVADISGENWIVDNVIYENGYTYGGNPTAMNAIVLDGEQLSGAAGHTIEVLIYNNTLGSEQLSIYSLRQVAGSNITIKNNILVDVPYGGMFLSSHGGTHLDYNYYAGGDNTPIVWGATPYTLAAFKTATGEETNSRKATTAVLDLNANYIPKSTSDSNGRGVDLSAIFTVDKINVDRGADWDMGAYQYATVGGPVTHNTRTNPHGVDLGMERRMAG